MEEVGENVDESKARGSGKSWFAVCHEMLTHEVVGAHIPPPKPADPGAHAWQPFAAWQWLISEAAWCERTIVVQGEQIALRRGQLSASQRYIARKLNWGHKAVREFLDRLARHGMIETSLSLKQFYNGTGRGTGQTVITISNYGTYQPEARQKGTTKGTGRAQQGHSRGTKEYIDTRIHRSTAAPAREADADATNDPVTVNGAAIYGPGFTLDFGAIDIAAGLYGVPLARARQLAEVCARDWAANGTTPKSPIATVKRALAEERDRNQTNDARAGPPARPRTETVRERQNREFDEKVFGGKPS